MENAIITILEAARDRLSKWLPRYKSWQGKRGVNGITERNLTLHVAIAFLDRFKDGMAHVEVPFAEPGESLVAEPPKSIENKHLDAYLSSDSLALLVESKTVWEPTGVNGVAADMDRMSPGLVRQLQGRHLGPLPASTHGLVIAETWNSNIAEWWQGNDAACQRWKREPLLSERPSGNWKFGYLKVLEVEPGSSQGTLFWLYGISQELNPNVPELTGS